MYDGAVWRGTPSQPSPADWGRGQTDASIGRSGSCARVFYKDMTLMQCEAECDWSRSVLSQAELALVEKVVAYITNGDRLLVFRRVGDPAAGIQAPAGTVEPGESTDEAVLREAHEETGLVGLTIQRFLGALNYNGAPFGVAEVHRRYYYHLEYEGSAPSMWRHFEEHPSGGVSEPPEFELFWVKYPDDVPEIASRLGDFLDGVVLE